MKFEPVHFSMQGNQEDTIPYMMHVRQNFSEKCLEDPAEEVFRALSALKPGRLDGKRIAVTAGSRRIANLPVILRAAGDFLKGLGALPFIVPAMGSHGGATAEGQLDMLARLGITQESTGMPILSDMQATPIGTLESGCRIYCSRTALQADGIVVCGRIKPHTSIQSRVESGLCKMMVVGLGKHAGAASFHRQGYPKLAQTLLEGGELFLKNAPILCGLGIVENAFDQTLCIRAVPPETLIEQEAELLALAKENMPRFLLDEIDVLVVDQIGKDVSGGGMDPNITGRSISPAPAKRSIPIHSIVVLDLTDASHGNATGIGGADITTRRLAEKIDLNATYTNVLTSGALMAARLPVILNNDKQAIQAAVCCIPRESPRDVKVVRIKDTLHMTEIQVSANYFPFLSTEKRIQILGGPAVMQFDDQGQLI